MEGKNPLRFTLRKQSSLAPEKDREESDVDIDVIDPGVRLMYLANEGDLEGIQELVNSGVDVNFRDIDGRTALHIASCQGLTQVVALLLDHGAEIDPKDRWGSTLISKKFPGPSKVLEKVAIFLATFAFFTAIATPLALPLS